MKYKIILIDGNNLLWRSFYAHKQLRASRGLYTGLIFGYMRNLLFYKAKYGAKGCRIINCFDSWSQVRKDILKKCGKQYKPSRKKRIDEKVMADFINQEKRLFELLYHMGMFMCQEEGVEADDLLHTISKDYSKENKSVAIISGDHDMFQCIDENIHIIKPGKNGDVVYDIQRFSNEYNIYPARYVEVMSLAGCQTDEIPGLPGIGEKKAIDIINKGFTYNKIRRGLFSKNDFTKSVYEKLKDTETIRVTNRLVKLYTVPYNIELTKMKFKLVYERFEEYKFHTFLKGFDKIKELAFKRRAK